MEYMRKIAPEGSKFGIVKIIPPDSWNPNFAVDTEVSAVIAIEPYGCAPFDLSFFIFLRLAIPQPCAVLTICTALSLPHETARAQFHRRR